MDCGIHTRKFPAARHRQPKLAGELGAQPFVFDRCGEIRPHAPDLAQRELQDVGGGGGSERLAPPILVPQQCGFFLGAGDGDPRLFLLGDVKSKTAYKVWTAVCACR